MARIQIARDLQARVVEVEARGYGSALMGGIAAARGRFIVMGDADDSYDFGEVPRFVEQLRLGYDLVQGCRMPGYLNQVLPRGARVATNAQPFYYLEHPIVHLHPMSEDGHFQLVKTPAELVGRFQDLKVDVVAYGETIVPPENYTESSVDVLAYLRNLSAFIRGAEKDGGLRLLRTLGGVKIYAVAPRSPRDPYLLEDRRAVK